MSKGFTIIELVISIFVLSIAVVGIFNALSIIIILTSDSADRLTATYLAQEGMEIVRNIRDTNWLNMDTAAATGSGAVYSWMDGLASGGAGAVVNSIDCTGSGSPCQADYTYDYMHAGEDYLFLNSDGFYSYSGVATKFKRRIIIDPIADVNDIVPQYHILKVKVEVSWDRKATLLDVGGVAGTCGKYNCITTEGTLYNWYNTAISVTGVEVKYGGAIIDRNDSTALSSGELYQLEAVVSPDDANNKSVSWASDNSSCVTVDTSGLLTAVGITNCEAYITVTTADGSKTCPPDVGGTCSYLFQVAP